MVSTEEPVILEAQQKLRFSVHHGGDVTPTPAEGIISNSQLLFFSSQQLQNVLQMPRAALHGLTSQVPNLRLSLQSIDETIKTSFSSV